MAARRCDLRLNRDRTPALPFARQTHVASTFVALSHHKIGVSHRTVRLGDTKPPP